MPRMGLSEFFVIALLALVRYGIPIAFAVWVFRSLQCIRADQEALRNKLETIEHLMNKAG